MRIGLCPLPCCGWTHETLLRPAIMFADHTAITCFHSSGLAEIVDLMKVAPGLEQVRALAVDIIQKRCRGWCQTNSNQSQFSPNCVNLCGTKLAPLGKCGASVEFEIVT